MSQSSLQSRRDPGFRGLVAFDGSFFQMWHNLVAGTSIWRERRQSCSRSTRTTLTRHGRTAIGLTNASTFFWPSTVCSESWRAGRFQKAFEERLRDRCGD